MLGFQEYGFYMPTYNWWAREAVQRLVAGANRVYDGSGIQFKVQEVRTHACLPGVASRVLALVCVDNWQWAGHRAWGRIGLVCVGVGVGVCVCGGGAACGQFVRTKHTPAS